jgi:hypothetical protein
MRPEQRELLGYDPEMPHDDQISMPYTKRSNDISDMSSDESTSTTTDRLKRRKLNLSSKNDDDDDSISQTTSTANEANNQALTSKSKNIFKRVFNFLRNKSQDGSKQNSNVKKPQPFLEKEGSFRFGSFRPQTKSTPQPELRRSKRIKNLDKIDYNLYHRTGQKHQD